MMSMNFCYDWQWCTVRARLFELLVFFPHLCLIGGFLQTPDEKAAFDAVQLAFKQGINFFDVAPFYAAGKAEEVHLSNSRETCLKYSAKNTDWVCAAPSIFLSVAYLSVAHFKVRIHADYLLGQILDYHSSWLFPYCSFIFPKNQCHDDGTRTCNH